MKRNKNKKIVLASTIVLGIAAITSSALAAYIITGGATNATADVKKPTGITVENNIVDLQVDDISDQLLLFYPEATISNKVVTSTEEGNLTINLPLSIEAGSKDLINDKTIRLTVTEKETGTLVNAGDRNYVTVPVTQEIKGSSLTDDDQNNIYEKTVPLKWGWGSTFGGKDPATYCNDKIADKSMTASQANKLLGDFKKAVDACPGFTISIDLVDAQPGA